MDEYQAHNGTHRDYTQLLRDVDDSEEQASLKNKALNSLLNKFKLKPTLATSDTDPSNMCSSCRRVDFETIFFDKAIWSSLQKEINDLQLRPDSPIPVYILQRLDPRMMGSSCLLCKLLATMVYGPDAECQFDEHELPIWHLRAVACPPNGQIALFLTEKWDTSIFIGPYWENSMEKGWLLPHLLPHLVESPRLTCFYKRYLLSGVPLDENVDYSRVKWGLTGCETHHGQYCSGTLPNYPINARVIDCTEKTVVPLTLGMEYIALSYVWGPQEPQCFTADDGQNGGHLQWRLPKHIPQSIEDSMEVIKRLNLRYLWVDRYCIQQVHAADKKFQISQMARIHGRAYATICALGPHDEYGLYGVSKPRARNYFHGRNMKITTIKAYRPARIKSYIDGSNWSKRGWTYQEALLSRRCLFFTPEGSFMVCREWCTGEGINLPIGDDDSRKVRITPAALFTRWSDDSLYFAFQVLVEGYQKRTLKYDSDRLSALEGLLSIQELSTVLGVPVIKISQSGTDTVFPIRIGFILGLVWRCDHDYDGFDDFDGDNYSCIGFPTWSWLSRKRSTIHFENFRSLKMFLPEIPNGPTLYIPYYANVFVQTSETKLETIENFLAPFVKTEQDKAITEDLRYLYVESLVAIWHLREDSNVDGGIYSIKVQFKITIRDQLPYWLDYEGNSPEEEQEILGVLYLDDPKRPHRTEGIAVLMLVSFLDEGQPCNTSPIDGAHRHMRGGDFVEMVWLAIHETADGTYHRDGIIKSAGLMRSSTFDRAARRYIEAPFNLETIRLG
jgi:hypothetical protein